ncbi:SIMPL domain-containing protein [Pseudomonas sp. Marseille-QA0892]
MSGFTRFVPALAAGLIAAQTLPAVADEARYNQITLRADVSHQVARDRMQVSLYTEAQDADPAKLAAQITKTLNTTLADARQVKGVEVSQGSRSSYPIYDDKGQKITGWRERASIQLESGDFAALSDLTGKLLGQLSMGSMSFSVSDEARKRTEDALIREAVDAFKARAQLATDALGGSSYKIVSLNLNTSGFQPPLRMQAMAKSARMEDATPDIEAGNSDIGANADGVIEVQMP